MDESRVITLSPVKRYLLWARPYWVMIGVVILLGCLQFVAPLSGPWMMKIMVDQVLVGKGPWHLKELVTVIICIIILGISMNFLRDLITARLGNRMMKDLRQQLFEHLQKMSVQFYDQRQVGSIASRVIHDIGGAQNLIGGGVINLVLDLLLVIFAAFMLFHLNSHLTLTALWILPLYYLAFTNMNVHIRLAWRAVHRQMEKMSGTLVERMSGIRVVQAFTGETQEQHRFKKQGLQHFNHTMAAHLASNILGRFSETFAQIGGIIIWIVGGTLVLQGTMTIGELIAFQAYVSYLYGPIQRFADVNVTIQNSVTNIERIFEMFDEKPDVVEDPAARPMPECQGRITFEQVSFRYITRNQIHLNQAGTVTDHEIIERDKAPGRFFWVPTNVSPKPPTYDIEERQALLNVSFEAQPGQIIALVGPSGAGKSTLINFIPRFYDPLEGRILIDGHDIRDYRIKDIRDHIALVLQDNILFSGSIKDNIVYGRPGASMEDVIDAAKSANADEFINTFKDKYDSIIGERGMRLSGGQKQRLAIARALLKNPQILILDEATSALDAESEALVTQALDRLMVGRTTFIIAHRLATVVRADMILVMENGTIVQRGSHAELLNQGGLYRKLYEQQLRAMKPEEIDLAMSV
jgi:ABC-type multidrug transport system fused ATPase/permease subunit